MNTNVFLLSVTGDDFRPCDWALAALDEPTLRRISGRRASFNEAKRLDDELYETYYWDGSAVTFLVNGQTLDNDEPLDENEARAENALELLLGESNKEVRRLEDAEALDGHREASVECVQMIISEYGVRWMCYPKHVDAEMRTAEIPWTTLDALAVVQ